MTPYVSSGTAAGFCTPLGKGLAAASWQPAAKLLHSEGAPPPKYLAIRKAVSVVTNLAIPTKNCRRLQATVVHVHS